MADARDARDAEEGAARPRALVVGVDEAGVGPGFGSVWAAAVALEADPPPGLTDSKKLSERRRAALRDVLRRDALYDWARARRGGRARPGRGAPPRLRARARRLRGAHGPHANELVVDGTLFRPWRGACHARACRAPTRRWRACRRRRCWQDGARRAVLRWCADDPALDPRPRHRVQQGYLSARHIEKACAPGYSEFHRRSRRARVAPVAFVADGSALCRSSAPTAPPRRRQLVRSEDDGVVRTQRRRPGGRVRCRRRTRPRSPRSSASGGARAPAPFRCGRRDPRRARIAPCA